MNHIADAEVAQLLHTKSGLAVVTSVCVCVCVCVYMEDLHCVVLARPGVVGDVIALGSVV